MSRIANDDLWETASKTNPQVAAQIDASVPVLGWNPDRFGEMRSAAATIIKDAGLPTRLYPRADGGILIFAIDPLSGEPPTRLLEQERGAVVALEDDRRREHGRSQHVRTHQLPPVGPGPLASTSAKLWAAPSCR